MSVQKGSIGDQSIRIVYCGPSESGKTTNLEVLARVLPNNARGSLLRLATETNRTLYFDLLRIELASRSGARTMLELYTVPGQSFYLPARRRVLRDAHGVVFVADSRRERLDANVEALNDVAAAIQDAGRDVDDVPAVLQLNKCDAATALSSHELLAALGCEGEPFVEAVAHEGRGVVETLRRIAKFTIAGQLVAETI
jgi:signal recognition particle receptor subunit beta